MAKGPDDVVSLLSEIRAHLSWEAQLGGIGVPRLSLPSGEGLKVGAGVGSPLPEGEGTRGVAQKLPLPSGEGRGEGLKVGAGAGSPLPNPLPKGEGSRGGEETRAAPADKHLRLQQLMDEVRVCTRCDLAKGRTKTVFARGNPDSPLMFIGEGPGQEEDLQGLPFVGPAGQLLDKMIAAMGYRRDDVYICNVVKCRPPNNRTPLPSEAGACAPFLLGQIEAVRPRFIVALGRCAAENLGLVPPSGGWRGRWGAFHGVPVMPTYHPAFLLRSPEYKRPVWEDLQKVMARLKEQG